MAERLKFVVFAGIFIILSHFMREVVAVDDSVFYLSPGELFDSRKDVGVKSDLKIFCYSGQNEHLLRMFQSPFLELNITTDDFDIYEGGSVEEVKKQHDIDQTSWSLMNNLWGSYRSREFQLKPFNTTCIGVLTKQSYSVKLVLLRISYYRLIMLFAGIFIFFMAPKLGRNEVFHYLSGVSLGVVASFLILVFIISRLFPRKPVMYGIMFGGWFVLIYMMNLIWDNMRQIATDYKMHFTAYAVLSAAISFIVCYRMGPVTNPRTMDIIQWGLQAVGLILVLMCSHFQEATIGLAILMLSIYNMPASFWAKILFFWHRMFPPKRKLLTMEEYEEEGARETEKALDELRTYCNSPQCNAWDLSLKLNDSTRFAKFIKGESHLNDEEMMEYNVIKCQTDDLLTDDENEDY